MATPKLDYLCVDFINRIPDVFREAFEPGQGYNLPDGNFIKKEQIMDYVNRGMMDLFNNYWQAVNGNAQKFISIFPELVKLSGNISLASGNYIIKEPYKDLFKIIGAVTTGNKYIKVKDEYLYTLYLSGEYKEYTADNNNPVIIQINNMVAVFPQTFSGQIKLHYIRSPLDPNTGGYLQQNGSEDSPFHYHWHKQIVDYAYLRYLQETNQTS